MTILEAAGYDRWTSLKEIKAQSIEEIEQFINENRWLISEIPDESTYSKIQPFQILPGHRVLMGKIPKYIQKIEENRDNESVTWNLSDFSLILRCLIETAQSNSVRNIKTPRYSETIQGFASYLYLMCGRACYDTLSENLPIPQSNTICKYPYNNTTDLNESILF